MHIWVFSVSNVRVEIHHSFLRYLSVDPTADLCRTNQIYSVLLNAFEFKEITEVQNAHLKVTKRDLVVASTRHHHARFLKYYPRALCMPSFVKLRMLSPIQTHFLLFQQIIFILVCTQAWTPRVAPWVLAQRPKPCPSGAITIQYITYS